MKLKVCDAHCDTLSRIATNTPMDQMSVTPERLREGGVSLQTFALWSGRHGLKGDYEGIAAAEYAQVEVLKAAGLKPINDEIEFLPFWEKGVRFFKVLDPNNAPVEFCQIL